jgi:hypothetical protein
MTARPVDLVSIAGGYWTGASAVVNVLMEHRGAVVLPGEFTLFSFGQFFQEVTTPLALGASLTPAARRTLWRYREFNADERFSLARRVARRSFAAARLYPASLSVQRTGAARKLGDAYVRSCEALLAAIAAGSAHAADLPALVSTVLREATVGAAEPGQAGRLVGVFDQLIAPPYLADATPMLPGLRVVMVDRDWRDQYLSMRPAYTRMSRANRRLGVRPWDEPATGPLPAFRDYFIWLRRRIEAEQRQAVALPPGRVLWTTFEHVVNHPEVAARDIFRFVGLREEEWRRGEHFHPDQSRRRVGKWRAPGLAGSDALREIDELTAVLGEPRPAGPDA